MNNRYLIPIFLLILCLNLSSNVQSIPSANPSSTNNSSLSLSDTIKNGIITSYNATSYETYRDVNGTHNIVTLGDGNVSQIWNNVPSVHIPSYGDLGRMASIYGKNDIYFFLEFDASYAWAAVQWDSDYTYNAEVVNNGAIPMDKNDDIWVLGTTQYSGVLGDCYSAGQATSPYMYQDVQNDLQWERILVHEKVGDQTFDYYVLEIKRAINTHDTAGHDMVFTPDKNVTVMMASSVFHKVDFKITQMKFVMSKTNASFDALPASAVPVNLGNIIDGKRFLVYNIMVGLEIGIGIQFFILLVIMIKRRY